jgi:spore germination protein
VDFEFIPAKDAGPYAAFITRLREQFTPRGLSCSPPSPPRLPPTSPASSYEGHNYALLGAAANELLLMTYEWGIYMRPYKIPAKKLKLFGRLILRR